MTDPTSAPQVVQQVHPSWFDWITVAAIIVGPVFALFAQRALDWIREKKTRRVQLYLTAMSFRATWLHVDSLRALNSIDTVFSKRSDKPIRDAWAKVIAHANTKQPDMETDPVGYRAWNDRMFDLRIDLYQVMGATVGYKHTVDYLKTQVYYPKYHVDAEQEGIAIRKQLAKAITDDGLKVVVLAEPERRK
jgi:hypothetical protein